MKLSRPTDTPTQASNLIDDLHKTGEKQKVQKYQKAVDKLYTKSMIATIKQTFRTNNFHENAEKRTAYVNCFEKIYTQRNYSSTITN